MPAEASAAAPQITAGLIVRDEAACLADCLASIAGVVDEIVVVDTGSRDATVDIARRFTDRVFHFAWIDDFAAARNHCLDRARGVYFLMIDADNTLCRPECARAHLDAFIDAQGRAPRLGGRGRSALKREEPLLETRPSGKTPQNSACSLPTWALLPRLVQAPDFCTGLLGTVEIVSVWGQGPEAREAVEQAPRFFQRAAYRYEGAIHEQLVRRDGQPFATAATGLRYTHSGYNHAPDSPAHKSRRNIPLLERELARRPDDAYYWFQLGKAHFALEAYGAAVEAFEQALAALRFEPGQAPEGRDGPMAAAVTADLLTTLAYAYVNTNRVQAACALLEAHRRLAHHATRTADFHHALGYVYLMAGDVVQSRAAYEAALACGPTTEIVRGTGSFAARYHLGLLCEAAGDLEGALRQHLEAIRGKPDYAVALKRCAELVPEYGIALPGALWDLADRDALKTVYADAAAQRLRDEGVSDNVKRLLAAAQALAPELFEACRAALSA